MPRKEDARALKMYERTHWGQVGQVDWRELRCADPTSENVVELGELVEIVYRTRKGRDKAPADYEHAFSRELPRLCFTLDSRLLIIAGGSYRVGERGIVG